MKPTIRIASIEEVDLVSDILCEAAKWLTEKGEPLWKADELAAEKLSVDVSNGMFYIAWVGKDSAGVFKFQTEDKLFWPDVPDNESCFIHRVAVRRNHAGTGISSAMIDYAKAATEAMERQFLRLDTDATRPKLRAVYEKQGFRFHSTRQVGPYFVARYEIEVGTANQALHTNGSPGGLLKSAAIVPPAQSRMLLAQPPRLRLAPIFNHPPLPESRG